MAHKAKQDPLLSAGCKPQQWFQHTVEAALQVFMVLKPQHPATAHFKPFSLPLMLFEGAPQRKNNTTGSRATNTPGHRYPSRPEHLSKMSYGVEPSHGESLKLRMSERDHRIYFSVCICFEAQDTFSPMLSLFM